MTDANATPVVEEALPSEHFATYVETRSANTLRNQRAALILWMDYLQTLDLAEDLMRLGRRWAVDHFDHQSRDELAEIAAKQQRPLPFMYAAYFCQYRAAAWKDVTAEVVRGFANWMLEQGYSVATVNNRLSAIRVYARLAHEGGAISKDELARIRGVSGFSEEERQKINKNRATTRVGHKKRGAIEIEREKLEKLKSTHPRTPQGARDRVLMTLMVDLGLRASEMVVLDVESVRESGYLHVFRPTLNDTVRLPLSDDAKKAIRAYKKHMRKSGTLLRGSRKSGKLTDEVMSKRAIGQRVKVLGRSVLDIPSLSPHDLRHSWALYTAADSTVDDLKFLGGWSDAQTPMRYIEQAQSKEADE